MVDDLEQFKQNILIVDDNKVNRELLMLNLGDKYNYCEADKCFDAIKIIEDCFDRINLVILDLVMPDMNGIDLLKFMNEKKLIEKIPVFVVTTDDNMDSILSAYRHGIIDYCTLPYNREILQHKISNALMFSKKITIDLDDTMNLLNDIFHKILKVNLTDDTYSIITTYADEKKISAGFSKKISEWMKKFAFNGYVHDEDREEYLEFVDINNLRRRFKEKKERYFIKYRRRVANDFRWVEMELYPSYEYTDDNQIILLCIRDINDEYNHQLEEYSRLNADAISFSRFLLHKDACVHTSYDIVRNSEFISLEDVIRYAGAQIISEDEKKEFFKIFSREGLIQRYALGEHTVSFDTSLHKRDKASVIFRVRFLMKMHKDTMTNEIDAQLYVIDVSKEYINKTLPLLLFEREYNSVGIISVVDKSLYIQKAENNYRGKFVDGGYYDYHDFLINKTEKDIPESEAERFLKATSIDEIIKMMEKQEIYVVNVVDNAKKYSRIKYQWFDKNLGLILLTIDDISEMSDVDLLTRELNRRGFVKHVEKILSENATNGYKDEYVIMYFDVMDFKAVNELFGFEGGDNILKLLPMRFRTSKLTPKVIARVTGDQFICLVNRNDLDFDEVEKLCEYVFNVNDKQITLFMKCGIYYVHNNNIHVRIMCDHAKLALNYVENAMVKPYAVYDDKMSASYLDKSEIIAEVKRAFENDEFCAYYQPIYDPKTNRLVSAEALVRWIHPERGMISPGVFVPILEEIGIITRVDLYIARKVKALLEERAAVGNKIVPISVNLSRMDFYDIKMMEQIKNCLEDTSLERKYFRYEVTESSYMSLTENNIASLNRLRELGAMILIDDFGSGYSSFGAITDYDFDIIKLDMEFVRRIGKNDKVASVIHSLIDMIHHMDAKVIAEGAETQEQVDFLRRHDCDYIQGYFYSRPLPVDDFIKLLDSQ